MTKIYVTHREIQGLSGPQKIYYIVDQDGKAVSTNYFNRNSAKQGAQKMAEEFADVEYIKGRAPASIHQ